MSPSDITVMTITVMTSFNKGGMHRKQEYPLREDSLGSQMSKSQLLKREWSEDMAQNVRAHGCESR